MPTLWIAVDADLGENDKVRALSRLLFTSPAVPAWIAVLATEGLLANLWGKFARYQEDGRADRRDDEQIEEWAKWKGKAGQFASAFRAEMTTAGRITDWDEWQTPLIEYRRKERERYHRRKHARGAPTGANAEPPPESPPEPPPPDIDTDTDLDLRQEPSVSSLSAGARDFALALIVATNRGMQDHPLIGERGMPIHHGHGASLEAAERIQEAGIDLLWAESWCYTDAKRYKPTARSPQIRSLGYFLPKILNDWDSEMARQAAAAGGAPPELAAPNGKPAGADPFLAELGQWADRERKKESA